MQAKFISLKNNFIQATITNYGARLTALITPDKNGKPVDVVAGFDSVDAYLNATSPYYGATIGRFANRMSKGQFTLNGHTYQSPINNGPNSLHGGSGLHDKIWEITDEQTDKVSMQVLSPDGEDGYPGELNVTVTYSLKNHDLVIDYQATTDQDTVINLTNHAYFNLNGENSGSMLNHFMQINASRYIPVDETLIPTGEIAAVTHSPFDFRQAKTIGQHINADHDQLKIGHGYDHTFVLDKNDGDVLTLAAKVTGDATGITMDILTTEPGMQFYTGNFMDGTNTFKSGVKDSFRTTFALETQHFPDSPNQPDFPSTLLKPGTLFETTSVYRFGVEN